MFLLKWTKSQPYSMEKVPSIRNSVATLKFVGMYSKIFTLDKNCLFWNDMADAAKRELSPEIASSRQRNVLLDCRLCKSHRRTQKILLRKQTWFKRCLKTTKWLVDRLWSKRLSLLKKFVSRVITSNDKKMVWWSLIWLNGRQRPTNTGCW